MQNIENAFEIEIKTSKILHTHRWIYQNTRGSAHQITIIVTNIKREAKPNITLNMVSKWQEKTTKRGREEKRTKIAIQKKVNGSKYTLIHKYIEFKWIKISN